MSAGFLADILELSSVGPASLREPELKEWGERVGREAAVPLVLALRGELGAGKSVLARAVARGAGVRGAMPSPTYNLVLRYDGRDGLEIWHVDLYRLEDPEEVWELGWRELGEGRQIVLIEWPERAEALLPADRWAVTLELNEDRANERIIHAEARGNTVPLPSLRAKGTECPRNRRTWQ